jgi:(R)-2-hydroxyacyl-CoA dehydratese activating ATPase
MGYTLGIDAGSSFSKAVICEGKNVASYAIVPSGGNYAETARNVAEAAAEKTGISLKTVGAIIATGYGAAAVDFADRRMTDISCHAAGIHHLFPSARTIVDIGGQFSKVIQIDETGRATNFVQNEKCAAGSGKFLQVIARILHISVEEIGELSLRSTKPVDFTTGCAVFAESEVVSRISEGARPEDILAGVHEAMAAKILNLIVRLGFVKDCALTGGGAKDAGLVQTIGRELGVQVLVPEEPRISGAVGAALQGT